MVWVEYFEGIYQIVEGLFVSPTLNDYFFECLNIETSGVILINFILHLGDFCFCWIQIQGADEGSQLTGRHNSFLAFVE